MKFKIKEEYELLTEATLNRIISGHNTDGYVMISASRHDCLDGQVENPSEQQIEDENNKRTTNLKMDIRRTGYSFIPVFGGYKEEGSEEASIEKSFIVFPKTYEEMLGASDNEDFNEFEEIMKNLGKKYNQDAILIKEPEKNPRYYFLNTDSWDNTDFGNVSLKDAQQMYFTSLKKWKDSSLNRKNHDWEEAPKRFTYKESYLNKPPQTIMGANARYNSGELFSMEHYKKSK